MAQKNVVQIISFILENFLDAEIQFSCKMTLTQHRRRNNNP